MNDLKTIKIAGEIAFAKDMTVPNTTFNADETRLACTVCNLSDAAVAALEREGVKIKTKSTLPELGRFFTSKSKHPFKPMDEDGNLIDPAKVGNGSKVVVAVTTYDHKMSKMHGKSVSIHKLIVTDLKEYNPQASTIDTTEAL
jgi:phage gp16-like protein